MTTKSKALGTNLEVGVVERAKAKGLRARKQPGSGVYKDFPADVEVERILVECKVRQAGIRANGERTVAFYIDWLRQVQQQALSAGYEQGVVVVRPKGDSKPFVVADLDWFLGLLVTIQQDSSL